MNRNRFETNAGFFELERYPARKTESLLAWNAADALLVEQIQARELPVNSVLCVNDEHGALSVALQVAAAWTDSALSAIAIEQNLDRNDCPGVAIIASTSAPAGDFSAVAMKVPKLMPYFEYQLALLAAVLPAGVAVIAGGMDKHLFPGTAGLLEKYIGTTQRHRGRSKARTFTAIRDKRPALPPPQNASYHCPELAGDLIAMANVFSRESLDQGSRFLIENIDGLPPAAHLVDLACGNGVLGLIARRKDLCATLALCDESAMAVASARQNAAHLMPENLSGISFHQADGLLNYDGPQADLVLCNPPFHTQHTVEEYVGRRLLAQSAAHLVNGGRLCLVANRHLQYLPTLKKGFSRVAKLAQNNKFIVWLAEK